MKNQENVLISFDLLCKICDALGGDARWYLRQYKSRLEANADLVKPEVITEVNTAYNCIDEVYNQVAKVFDAVRLQH